VSLLSSAPWKRLICNCSIRTRISALRPIVFHTGSRKARFTSLRFDAPMLCHNSCAPNGTLTVQRGSAFIRRHGMPKPSVSITSVFLVRLSAGLMRVTARVSCDVRSAQQLLRKRCVTLMATEFRRSLGWLIPNHVHAVLYSTRCGPWRRLRSVGRGLPRAKSIRCLDAKAIFGSVAISIALFAMRNTWQTAFVTSGAIPKKHVFAKVSLCCTRATSPEAFSDTVLWKDAAPW
jgi:hypothetical protein